MKDLVFATNSPTNHLFAVHTKEAAYRSYVIGLKIEKGHFPDILLWDTCKPAYHYVRLQEEKDHDVLIVGGEDHRVGQGEPEVNHYKRLDAWVKRKLGIDAPIIYQWSGQILETLDGLAYIGKSPHSSRVYEVSGDSGHGLTHGTIAGKIISDLIMGRKNSWSSLYDPARKTFGAVSNYIKENLKGASTTVDWVLPAEASSEDEIKEGEGAILRKGISKVAVYKDEDGVVHECSAVCPHLGALVRWNSQEKTWDCPFHGSRFTPDGEVINGPAHTCLKKVEVEEKKE